MNTPIVELKIDLQGIGGRVVRQVLRVTHFLKIGLQVDAAVVPPDVRLPGAEFEVELRAEVPWASEGELRNGWAEWLMLNGFRDVAELISGVLEEAQSVLATWQLIDERTRDNRTTTADFDELIIRRQAKFHRLSLKDKIEFFRTTYGLELDERTQKCFLSVNAARNCLAHRGGVVQERDVDASGCLVLTWMALIPFIEKDEQLLELTPGVPVVGPGTLGVQLQQREKRFSFGDKLAINAREFVQICWSIYFLAQALAVQLEKIGRARGIVFTEPSKP